MIFSRAAVDKLLDSGCACGKDEDPDDMIIGMCAKRYDIPLTHSPLFHQVCIVLANSCKISLALLGLPPLPYQGTKNTFFFIK